MDLNEKRKYLKDSLDETGWEEILHPWLDSSNYLTVIKKLVNEVENGVRFAPAIKNWFNPFTSCSFDDLKVVFIKNESYNDVEDANGLAFSCNSSTKQPALRYLKQGIYETCTELIDSDDLDHLPNQGVLLYNASLTAQIGKLDSHSSLWNKFTINLLNGINNNTKDVIVVLFGKKTHKWHSHLTNQKVIQVDDPLTGLYTKWEHDDLFNKINRMLINLNKSPIIW